MNLLSNVAAALKPSVLIMHERRLASDAVRFAFALARKEETEARLESLRQQVVVEGRIRDYEA